jgi:hypothetical protein
MQSERKTILKPAIVEDLGEQRMKSVSLIFPLLQLSTVMVSLFVLHLQHSQLLFGESYRMADILIQ